MSADITYAIDAEEGQTVFSANSPAGEEFLDGGGPERGSELARAAGLTIVPFPLNGLRRVEWGLPSHVTT
jgi:hypothetical protein